MKVPRSKDPLQSALCRAYGIREMKNSSSHPNSSEDPHGRGRDSEVKSSTALAPLLEEQNSVRWSTPDLTTSLGSQSAQSDPSNTLSEIEQSLVLTGAVLANKYKVLGLLGEGAMAVVYYVRDLNSGKLYAAKTLKFVEEELVARFAREVKIYEQLKHPNIVDALECVPGPGKTWISIMELIEGDSLEHLLEERGPIQDPEVFSSILSQLCDGLEYAHERGVIHRDLKPDNIIIRSDVEGTSIKILDFGLAKLQQDLQRLTKSGVVLGSPAYMSPEQCMGDPLDIRSDIYSIGVLAFEMLTGKLPYDEKTPVSMMRAHCDPDRLPLTLSSANITSLSMAPLQKILSKMLEFEPADRYEDLNELKRDLYQWWQQYINRPKGNQPYFTHVNLPKLKTPVPDLDQEINLQKKIELESLVNKQINTRLQSAKEKFQPRSLPRRSFNPRTFMPLAVGFAALLIVSAVLLVANAINSSSYNSRNEPFIEQPKHAKKQITKEPRKPTKWHGNRRKILGNGHR